MVRQRVSAFATAISLSDELEHSLSLEHGDSTVQAGFANGGLRSESLAGSEIRRAWGKGKSSISFLAGKKSESESVPVNDFAVSMSGAKKMDFSCSCLGLGYPNSQLQISGQGH